MSRGNHRCGGWRRLGLWVAMVAVVVACGSGADLGDAGEGPLGPGAARAAPDVATAIATSTPAPVVDPGPLPLEPWQVLVAVARPEITTLATFDAPDGEPVSFELPMRNPWYFGGELALLVVDGRETDDWLEVSIPVRPHGTTAWVRTADVEVRTHRMHAEVSLAMQRLRVWEADELLVEAPVVLGAARTPTPEGRFYVNARIEVSNPRGAYGPWILALSGYSEVLETFNGGIPTLAIHGTNRPDLLGRNRSNGCVRVHNDVIRELAEIVPLGMPVEIVA